MKKRWFCILLCFVLLLSLTGCNQSEAKEGEYQVYYLNMDKTKVVPEAYDSTGATGLDLVMELLERLKSAPDDTMLRQTIPSNVEVNGISVNGAYLYVDFSEQYNALTPTEEVLVRAAIVRTILQTDVCSLVSFTINSNPLLTHDGTLVGSMNRDTFVENPGEQINSSVQTTLTLYFANVDGTGLVKEKRDVHYSTNISMEKLVMEQLIEGPKRTSAQATIPTSTRLISVTVVNGVCYVNLGESFRNQSGTVTEDVLLYSIVNSLTELPGVTKVQLAINGNTDGTVRHNYALSTMYERDLVLLGE